jgi:hypothetical protein
MNPNLLMNIINHPAFPIVLGIIILMSPSSEEKINGIPFDDIKNTVAGLQIARGVISCAHRIFNNIAAQPVPQPNEENNDIIGQYAMVLQ